MNRLLTLLIFLTSLVSFQSFANDTAEGFEAVRELFAKGELPEISEIANTAYSGRCFPRNDSYEPRNSVFLIKEGTSSVMGPIYGLRYEATTIWEPSAPANFFDGMPLQYVVNYYREQKRPIVFKPIKIEDVSLKIFKSIDSVSHQTSSFRVIDGMIVEKYSDRSDENEVFAYCYYFNPRI